MNKNPRLARLYAQALHDATGGQAEIAALKPHFDRAGMLLTEPGISVDAYLALLGDPEMPEIRRLLAMLFRRKRRRFLDEIIEAYERIREEARGIRRAAIAVAFKPPPALVRKITALLAEHLGAREVLLDVTVDPGLIGGIQLQFKDTVLDGSVRASLERFREKF